MAPLPRTDMFFDDDIFDFASASAEAESAAAEAEAAAAEAEAAAAAEAEAAAAAERIAASHQRLDSIRTDFDERAAGFKTALQRVERMEAKYGGLQEEGCDTAQHCQPPVTKSQRLAASRLRYECAGLHENLTRTLFQLDEVPSHGDSDVRATRKRLATEVNQLADDAEELVKRAADIVRFLELGAESSSSSSDDSSSAPPSPAHSIDNGAADGDYDGGEEDVESFGDSEADDSDEDDGDDCDGRIDACDTDGGLGIHDNLCGDDDEDDDDNEVDDHDKDDDHDDFVGDHDDEEDEEEGDDEDEDEDEADEDDAEGEEVEDRQNVLDHATTDAAPMDIGDGDSDSDDESDHDEDDEQGDKSTGQSDVRCAQVECPSRVLRFGGGLSAPRWEGRAQLPQGTRIEDVEFEHHQTASPSWGFGGGLFDDDRQPSRQLLKVRTPARRRNGEKVEAVADLIFPSWADLKAARARVVNGGILVVDVPSRRPLAPAPRRNRRRVRQHQPEAGIFAPHMMFMGPGGPGFLSSDPFFGRTGIFV